MSEEFQKEMEVIWEDIGYIAKVDLKSHFMDFKVYRVTGGGDGTPFEYERDAQFNEYTKNLNEAQIFMSGHIKWDGCSNIKFDEQEKVMLHFCGKQSAIKIGELISRLYELAKEMPNADPVMMDE